MTDQCQILLSSVEYHILVYLVDSGEIEKCSFLVRLNLVWHELNLAIKSWFSFFNECTHIINSPSCCVLDAWNTLSKFVSLTLSGLWANHPPSCKKCHNFRKANGIDLKFYYFSYNLVGLRYKTKQISFVPYFADVSTFLGLNYFYLNK